MYMYNGVRLKSKLNTLDHDRASHDRPTSCVITLAVFSHHLYVIALLIPSMKIRRAFKRLCFLKSIFFKNFRKSEMAEPEIAKVGECLYMSARVHVCFLSLSVCLSLSLSLTHTHVRAHTQTHEITHATFLT